jgi:hypothetical protein
MSLTASKLRQDVYRILDKIIETGIPVDIVRRGKTLRISPAERASRLGNLIQRPYFNCDPEEIIHMDWSGEWKP